MVRELTYDASGTPVCNAVASCAASAAEQSEEKCGGCEDVAATQAEKLEAMRAEHGRYAQSVEVIKQELARRADAGEDSRLSAVEEVAVRLGMDKVKELGADIERLAAARAAVLAEHTHPVFACKKHTGKLPARKPRPDVPTEPHDVTA